MGSEQDATVPGATPGQHAESFAAAMLVVACLCWAAFFSLGKNWQEAAGDCPGGGLIAALTLMGVRAVLALAIYALVKPRLYRQVSRRAIVIGLFLGALNCLGNILQMWGLATTSPAHSGFFTSLACLWVPILAYVGFRIPIARATWIGMLLGIAGMAILGINRNTAWGLGFGDFLTVLSSFAFALYVLFVDRLAGSVKSSHLTLVLIAVTNLPALALAVGILLWQGQLLAWLTWLSVILRQAPVQRDVVLLTLLSTILATRLQSAYQPRVSASRAALIYLLEPVFAAALSVLLGHDQVTERLLVGGALILCGNALVELPLWIRSFRARRRVADALAPETSRTGETVL